MGQDTTTTDWTLQMYCCEKKKQNTGQYNPEKKYICRLVSGGAQQLSSVNSVENQPLSLTQHQKPQL
jgi:hypothetical protein